MSTTSPHTLLGRPLPIHGDQEEMDGVGADHVTPTSRQDPASTGSKLSSVPPMSHAKHDGSVSGIPTAAPTVNAQGSYIPPHSAAAEIHQPEDQSQGPSADAADRDSSSQSTVQPESQSHESTTHTHRSEENLGNLGEPSEKQYKRAGMAAAMVAGTGAAGAGVLAHAADREPRGWQNVIVEGKHHIWHNHPGVNDARKSALKVSAIKIRLYSSELKR
jgi:hypothetical protein